MELIRTVFTVLIFGPVLLVALLCTALYLLLAWVAGDHKGGDQ